MTTTPLLSSSDWIALSSAVVAICALGVSIWQGYVARLHCRLSVTPHIDVVFDVSGPHGNDITLKNGGLGPAIVRSVEVTLGGTTKQLHRDRDFEFLAGVLRPIASDCKFSHAVPDPHSVLSPDSELLLFRARSDASKQELAKAFNELIDRLVVKVTYCCIYKATYTCVYEGQHVETPAS
jgi:hypothetical protein